MSIDVIPPEEEEKHAPAVIKGVIQHVSVSQLQKADSCLRAWHFDKVQHLDRGPEGAGAKRGKAGHKRLESYLKTGDKAYLQHLELLGIERGYVPDIPHGQSDPYLLVEWSEVLPAGVMTAVPMDVRIDLGAPQWPVPEARDWKFKKSIKDYGCTPKQLANPSHEAGIQMIGYAKRLSLFLGGAQAVRVSHVTFQTFGRPDAALAEVVLTQTEIDQKWGEITERTVPRMVNAAKATNPQDVEPNFNVCSRYGGCPYLLQCQSPAARVAAMLAKIKAQKDLTPAPGVEIVSLPLTPPLMPPTFILGETKMGLFAKPGTPQTAEQATTLLAASIAAVTPAAVPEPKRLLTVTDPNTAASAKQGETYLVNGEPARFVSFVDVAGGKLAAFAPTKGGNPLLIALETQIKAIANILPPDAPASKPELAAKPAPGTAVPPAPTPVEAAAAPAQAEKRKRATRAEMAARNAVLTAPKAPTVECTVTPATPVPTIISAKVNGHEVVTVPFVQQAVTAPEVLGIFLYINCAPVGVPTQPLNSYVQQIDSEVQKLGQLNLLDIRTADDKVFGFGKWAAYFASSVKENPPQPGHYIAQTGMDQRLDVAANALMGLAGVFTVIG